MALLGLGYCLLAGELILQDGGGFGVAERRERAAVRAIAVDQAFGFFNQAAVEHCCSALVDAVVEAGSRRVEAETQDPVAGEGIAPFLPLLREGLIRSEADFDGADDFRDVVDVDGGGCKAVQTGEEAVQVGGSAGCCEFAEAFALTVFFRRCREETVDKRSQVETCASRDDRQVATLNDPGKSFAGLTAVVASGTGLVGPRDVDHVVLDESALLVRGFRGADFHLAVDRNRVAANDLTAELFR